MGKYRIKYVYDTGDSLNNYPNQEDYLDISHDDIDVAKENLKRIELHYNQYRELNNISWNSKVTTADILEKNKEQPWFVKVQKPCVYYNEGNKRKYQAIDISQVARYKAPKYEVGTFIDQHMAEHYIILLLDNLNPIRLSCPWCGYFETLREIEIEEDKSDRKIIF